MGLNRELGSYVGEYIVTHYMPSLSTDMLKTNNVITVSEEETNKWIELETIIKPLMFDKAKQDEYHEMFYKHLAWYKEMAKKYYPTELKCYVPKVTFTNKGQFIEGLKEALWDSDVCAYDTDGIVIKQHDLFNKTEIILKYK